MPARFLCVSIHDVAADNLAACRRLRAAIGTRVPVTLLVTPCWHRARARHAGLENFLEQCAANGDELALHGYVHLDEGRAPLGPFEHFMRRVYTSGEGEFAALNEGEAARRIALGQSWFAQRGWQAQGFVAPAWLLSPGSWRALRGAGFSYTTTARHFHKLGAGEQQERAPALGFWSRNAAGRWLSQHRNRLLAASRAPLLRLGFHPRDAMYPHTLHAGLALMEDLLAQRRALTKAAYARAPALT